MSVWYCNYFLFQVNKDILLSPGEVSKKHGISMDKKKLWHKKKHASVSFKRRRLLLKVLFYTLYFYNKMICSPFVSMAELHILHN